MKNNNLSRGNIFKNASFFVIWALASWFLFWKCQFGFGNIDESFYLTIPYRLYQGDALFLHEWHLSQMAGFLTYPLVSLYIKIVGSTEGIILAFRYICAAVSCIVAVFLYIRLKKFSFFGAVTASVSYILYIPFAITALSYNSMGITMLLVSLITVLTAQKLKNIQYAIAGLFAAAAVLCCPYLAGVYVLYLVAVLVLLIKKTKRDDILSLKGALWFTAGIAVLALVFAIFVLSRASISDIIEVFPYIMNDPEHTPISFIQHIKNFIKYIIFANDKTPKLYIALAVLGVASLFCRKKPVLKRVCFIIASILVLILMHSFYSINKYINHLMWSLNILAVFAFVLSKKQEVKILFYAVWIPGMLYSFCLNMASNQQFYAIASASSVALVGSIVMIVMFIEEQIAEIEYLKLNIVSAVVLLAVLTYQISTQGYMRYSSLFWDMDMKSQTHYVDYGPEAGLMVNEGIYGYYERMGSDIEKLEEKNIEKVLMLSQNTWYYLLCDYKIAAYSAWLAGVHEQSVDRLRTYYEINPDKKPDAVYTDEQYVEVVKGFCEELGLREEKLNYGSIFVK